MRIFYVDAYGSGGMSEGSRREHPWRAVCALSLPETARISLAGHLTSIKNRIFPEWQNHDWHASEIKGRYLRAAQRRFAVGRSPRGPSLYRELTVDRFRDLLEV